MTLKDLKTDKSVIRILQFIILILLVVTCITVALANMDGALFLLTLPTADCTRRRMASQTLFVRDFYKKIPFYVLDSILLVLLTLFATWRKPPQTSTSYLYLVYALVLSEYYLSSPRARQYIMFAVNIGVYTIEYAVVALVSNTLESAFATSSQYFTDLIILILHFIMFSFAMTVYRKNKLIEKSMEELEESKNELLRAYDKLEEATLLEERNPHFQGYPRHCGAFADDGDHADGSGKTDVGQKPRGGEKAHRRPPTCRRKIVWKNCAFPCTCFRGGAKTFLSRNIWKASWGKRPTAPT